MWARLLEAAQSLQCKATALVVALTLVVSAAVGAYFFQSSVHMAQAQRSAHLTRLASMLSRASAAHLASGDEESLRALAVEVANGSPLLYAMILDVDGAELASAEHLPIERAAIEDHRPTLLDQVRAMRDEIVPVLGTPVIRHPSGATSPYLDVSYPITVLGDEDAQGTLPRSRLVGYVRLGMAGGHWQRSMAQKMDWLVGVGVLAAVVGIPFGFLIIRRVVSRLDELSVTMLRFSRGDLSIRSPAHGNDEIGRCATAFNLMADQHQQTHERIVGLNAELEERVANRTRQLRKLAASDPLTGLYNRRHLGEVFERSLSEAIRYERNLACIMIDLDDFKQVNDAHGHQVGDQLLVLTSMTLTSQLRASDVAARYGGDEFVMLLPETDAESALLLGERIVARFQEDLADRLPKVRATLSMGIASLRDLESQGGEQLLHRADQAMYEAKAGGKNRIVSSANASQVSPQG